MFVYFHKVKYSLNARIIKRARACLSLSCVVLCLLSVNSYGAENKAPILLSKQKLTSVLNGIPQLPFRVVSRIPHSQDAYTQGLLINDGVLFESTGLYGSSKLRRIELAKGRVKEKVELPKNVFGEGLALWGDILHVLTWRNGMGFLYDSKKFKPLGKFKHKVEGWGLTASKKYIIQSDGSDQLYFINPANYNIEKQVAVKIKDTNISGINELEYVNGFIWANVFPSDFVIVINTQSGQVVTWLDFSELKNIVKQQAKKIDVLNGLAYDKQSTHMYVTGKLWPLLFEIVFDHSVIGAVDK